MVEPLLIELRRIATRAKQSRDPGETRALLVDLMLLRTSLEAERDEQGRELANVQRGVAAMNAYSHAYRRRT